MTSINTVPVGVELDSALWIDAGMTKRSLRLLVAFLPLMPVASAEGLSVVAVEYRDVDTTYSTEAVIEAVRQSTISAQVMGRIVELRADVGDFVKAGQIVARIDPREAAQVVASSEAQVAQARANLQNARINLERTRRLLESQFVSQSALDRANAEFQAAEAQLRAAEAGAGQATVSKGYTTGGRSDQRRYFGSQRGGR